jgi:hypothetical protein
LRGVPRHVVRDLDHAALRDYRRRATHFQLDARRPDPPSRRVGEGAPGRRATLPEVVAERFRERLLPGEVDRERFVHLGLQYLQRAEEAQAAALVVAEG